MLDTKNLVETWNLLGNNDISTMLPKEVVNNSDMADVNSKERKIFSVTYKLVKPIVKGLGNI